MSRITPFANGEIKHADARMIYESRSALDLRRSISCKLSGTTLASTRFGSCSSIAATIIVCNLVKLLRSRVIRRMTVRAAGAWSSAFSAFSALFRRVATSVTTRRPPPKPVCRSCRQSSAPFRNPASHFASSHGRCGSSEVWRTPKVSVL